MMNNVETLLTFWDVVAECLVVFHGLEDAPAHKKTKELRRRLRGLDRPDDRVMPSHLIYHEEPFYIACNLMNNQLDLIQHHEKYKDILARYGWEGFGIP